MDLRNKLVEALKDTDKKIQKASINPEEFAKQSRELALEMMVIIGLAHNMGLYGYDFDRIISKAPPTPKQWGSEEDFHADCKAAYEKGFYGRDIRRPGNEPEAA